MPYGDWTWLEVTKLISGLLTPAIIAGLGIYIHRVTKRFEHSQWKNQKLTEKRLSVYDELAPLLNDLLCYFTYVGGWRDFDPPQIIALKRVTDKKIYLAVPLFGAEFFAACEHFQHLCFETYGGWGRDACLRTHFERRKQARIHDWNPEWETCFSKSIPNQEDIQKAYQRIMKAFSEDIGVYADQILPRLGRIPHGIV